MFRVRAVEVPCVLNIAAVKLKSKDFDDAIYECNKVLEIEVLRMKCKLKMCSHLVVLIFTKKCFNAHCRYSAPLHSALS